MTEISSGILFDLAPHGKLRVGINLANVLLTRRDPVTGALSGVALDLAWELGRRLDVPVEIVSYELSGDLVDSATKSEWEVAFFGVEPQRANIISFTAPFIEIDATYMVPPDSPLQTATEVDRKGVRIVVAEKSVPDLYLSRTIRYATLVRVKSAELAFSCFVADKLDAIALLKPRLVDLLASYAGARIVDGRFTAVLQAAGTAKGHEAGIEYLSNYIEDAKASGLVARAIESNRVKGVTVAPKREPDLAPRHVVT